MSDRTVDVLMDPGDDVAVTRGLLAHHDPTAGLVVVHPTAATRQLRGLGHDALAALGAPITALSTEHLGGATAAWRAVRAWVIAFRVEHLVVLRAHRLDPRAWMALVDVAVHTDVRLLLVCHLPRIPTRLHRELAAAATVRVFDSLRAVTAEYGRRTRPGPRPRPPARRAYPVLPSRLPTGQVMHYRADVYRRHPLEVFAGVDDLYGRGLDAACRWLYRRAPPGPFEPDRDGRLQRFLTELVHDSPSPQHTLALLRGAQAGFLSHGCWLDLPNLSQRGGPGLTSVPITDETIERIRAGVANPALAAGVVLALITGIDLHSLRSLTLDALPPPTHVVSLPLKLSSYPSSTRTRLAFGAAHDFVLFYVPRAARPLLRAARAFLLAGKPDPRQRVFAGFSPMPPVLEQAAQRCAIALPRKPVELPWTWQYRARWLRLGESFHPATSSRGRPAGLSCATAYPAATHPDTAAPPYRSPGERLRARWSPLAGYPRVVARLLRTHLDITCPGLPPVAGISAQPTKHLHWFSGGPIERHLAVRAAPTDSGDYRLTAHPDLTFALRWTARPAAPAED